MEEKMKEKYYIEWKSLVGILVVMFLVFFLVEGMMLNEYRYELNSQSAYMTGLIHELDYTVTRGNIDVLEVIDATIDNQNITIIHPNYSQGINGMFTLIEPYAIANITFFDETETVIVYRFEFAETTDGQSHLLIDKLCIFSRGVPDLYEKKSFAYFKANSEIGTIWYI